MRVLLILFFFVTAISQAQVQSVDNYSLGAGGATRFNNYPALGEKIEEKLNYSEIMGNCFWGEDWNPALLVLKKGGSVKLKKVKLNLYTNDIHYTDNTGAELIASTKITEVLFYDRTDTAKISSMFKWFAAFAFHDKESFIQVLNEGKIQLLKNYTVLLNKEYDPINTRSEYRFTTHVNYFLLEEGKIEPVKSLNKSELFSLLKPAKEQEVWLKTNKNRLRNEANAIEFLSYLNHSD